MADLQTVLKNLKNHSEYLAQFPKGKESAGFEHLVTETFSHLFHLPFYTTDNDDANVEHRVVWMGSTADWSKAPPGADGVAYAHEFCMLLEPTLKEGSRQWSQEFASCIEHYDTFVTQPGSKSEACYLVLIATEFHANTYRSIKANVTQYRGIMLLLSDLVELLQIASLAFTIRNLDLRLLWNDLIHCCVESTNIEDFHQRKELKIKAWRRKVLEEEKYKLLGVRSYRAMIKMGRSTAGLSEIYSELGNDPTIATYYENLGRALIVDEVEESLKREAVAYTVGRLPSGETIYAPVPLPDVKQRANVFVKELESAASNR